MKKASLTNDEKARIIELYGKYPKQWTFISFLMGRPESTIRNYYTRYKMTGHFEEKRGRPPISQEKKQEVVSYFEKSPESTLREALKETEISISTMKKTLNENKVYYMKKIPIPNLTDEYKSKRVQFSNYIKSFPPNAPPKIIITDESTVEVNLLKGGIWRKRGHYPPGSFKGKDPHPVHVMVWGGIGPGGYKTKLLRVNGKMNSIKYIQLLTDNEIFIDLYKNFQNNYIFQQDNAPCHVSRYSKSVLNDCVPAMIDWPPKSPDLSPIEQVWNFLKGKMVGLTFSNADLLFQRLSQEWDAIPPEMIHNYYESFRARCIVCSRNNGESLNGHWPEVHQEHNLYRTNFE